VGGGVPKSRKKKKGPGLGRTEVRGLRRMTPRERQLCVSDEKGNCSKKRREKGRKTMSETTEGSRHEGDFFTPLKGVKKPCGGRTLQRTSQSPGTCVHTVTTKIVGDKAQGGGEQMRKSVRKKETRIGRTLWTGWVSSEELGKKKKTKNGKKPGFWGDKALPEVELTPKEEKKKEGVEKG